MGGRESEREDRTVAITIYLVFYNFCALPAALPPTASAPSSSSPSSSADYSSQVTDTQIENAHTVRDRHTDTFRGGFRKGIWGLLSL